jgi:gamma-glutamyl phosphate reductase
MSKSFAQIIEDGIINHSARCAGVENLLEHRNILKNNSDNRHNLYLHSLSLLMHCQEIEQSVLSNKVTIELIDQTSTEYSTVFNGDFSRLK